MRFRSSYRSIRRPLPAGRFLHNRPDVRAAFSVRSVKYSGTPNLSGVLREIPFAPVRSGVMALGDALKSLSGLGPRSDSSSNSLNIYFNGTSVARALLSPPASDRLCSNLRGMQA